MINFYNIGPWYNSLSKKLNSLMGARLKESVFLPNFWKVKQILTSICRSSAFESGALFPRPVVFSFSKISGSPTAWLSAHLTQTTWLSKKASWEPKNQKGGLGQVQTPIHMKYTFFIHRNIPQHLVPLPLDKNPTALIMGLQRPEKIIKQKVPAESRQTDRSQEVLSWYQSRTRENKMKT